ncbi:hypothetical protein [Haliangium sp.]|uniref:hypothetical protein n=1 Tax=Haliangium sp. TaxID=2663208 RepID=UPI003D1066AE
MARCTICHTRIDATDEVTECASCKQSYHASCWTELGGCGTYGCDRVAPADKPPPPAVVGAGWGDTKSCPNCHTDIASSLLVCGCGATFPWADPMTSGEYTAWKAEKEQIATSKKVLVGLFLGSLFGGTAPLCGPAAGLYAYSCRDRLAENGTYLALGYGSAALGLTYTLIIVLLALGL